MRSYARTGYCNKIDRAPSPIWLHWANEFDQDFGVVQKSGWCLVELSCTIREVAICPSKRRNACIKGEFSGYWANGPVSYKGLAFNAKGRRKGQSIASNKLPVDDRVLSCVCAVCRGVAVRH